MLPVRKPLGQILKEMELVSEGQIQEALSKQRKEGGAIGDILVKLGFIEPADLLFAIANQSGMEMVDLDSLVIHEDVLKRIPTQMAIGYQVIPIQFNDANNTLTVAMADPQNLSVLDELKFMCNCEVKGAVAGKEGVQKLLDRHYSGESESIDKLMEEFTGDEMEEITEAEGKVDISNVQAQANLAPVVKLLNLILLTAIKDRAADVHFEPFESKFSVRYRVDGVLYEMQNPPLHLALALISRIKVMSRLDISETRMPQDGRIELTLGGRPIDLRVSTLPTMFGESVVLRILDRSAVISMGIESIGAREGEIELFRSFIQMPDGIVLVTGPTGSGKTTTLYAMLQEANTIDRKILTAEDPVEYSVDGLIQTEVHSDIGHTFANALRAFLRQDPDMILVGEIRDLETADISIEASLTGHVVFSTLHTNDAPSAITRLLDLGVEPFQINATLKAIIAQRLVRKVCNDCKVFYEPSMEEISSLGLDYKEMTGKQFAIGKGCDTCNKIKYKGRIPLYEVMLHSPRIGELVEQKASTGAIAEVALEEGMRTLRQSGLLNIYDGVTSVEEVVKETILTV